MPIDFGNIQGNIVDSTGKGPGAVSAPSNQGNLVVSGGPHSDGPRQYEREFTPSPSPVDISGFPSQADQANFELQNLVQNKDYLQQFPSTQTPGTNLYQEGIANFINASPLNREIYKDTFPIGGAFNLFMTEVPEKIAQSTMLGNIVSSLQSGASQAKDFVGGLFPGDNTDLNNLFQDFASVPSGAAQDFKQMLTDLKDLAPGVSEVREELGVKKQDATDIVDTAFGESTPVSEADYTAMYGLPMIDFLSGGYNLPEKDRKTQIGNVAAQIMDPLPNQVLNELYAADIQNAIDFPNTEMAKKLRQLGLVK